MRSPWMSTEYRKLPDSKIIKLKRVLGGQVYYVLLNPSVGSWIVMNEPTMDRYNSSNFNELEMENLYLRCLASDDSGECVDMDFPKPADMPSVVVVNITTVCNLKCKYCFADCEPQKGEYMNDTVMEALIKQMLEMPTPLITYELQGGEPTCYLDGMERFIEISERLRVQTTKKIQYRTVTNCTLIDDRFVRLAKKYGLKIGISVDGPKELTDQVRVDEYGNGVFDRIMEGIQRLRENGLDTDGAVCTLGQHNVLFPKAIVNFFTTNNISFKPRPANTLGRELVNHMTTYPGQWADAFKVMYHESKNITWIISLFIYLKKMYIHL